MVLEKISRNLKYIVSKVDNLYQTELKKQNKCGLYFSYMDNPYLGDERVYRICKRFVGSSKKTASEAAKILSENLPHQKPLLPSISNISAKSNRSSVVHQEKNIPSTDNTKCIPKIEKDSVSLAKKTEHLLNIPHYSNTNHFRIPKKEVTCKTDNMSQEPTTQNHAPSISSKTQDSFPETSTVSNPSCIPIPPPLPPKPEHVKVTLTPINLKEQLAQAYRNRTARQDTISAQLDALDKRSLYDQDAGKVKHSFYQYLDKSLTNPQKTLVTLSENDFLNNPTINIGLLKVFNSEETVLLSGTQMHPILVYTLKDNNVIVWGYLTSEKDSSHEKLSNYQPFSKSSSSQFIRIITPLLIQATHIESLPGDQQANAVDYLQKQDIQEALKTQFINKSLPKLKHSITVYDGTGITSEDIYNSIKNYELDEINKAEKFFIKYKQMKNQAEEKDITIWLEKTEKSHKDAYSYLKILIKNHNENKKIYI